MIKSLSTLCLLALWLCMEVNAQNCTCSSPLKVATFNTLQFPPAVFRQERFDATINFFKQPINQFDILCLQELWDANQRETMISQMSSIYPYSVNAGSVNATCTDPCDPVETESILSCGMINNCFNQEDGFKVISCIVSNCKNELSNVKEDCRDCAFSLTNSFDIKTRVTQCAGQRFYQNTDLITSCAPLFNGSQDNVILSRYNITQKDAYFYKVSPFVQWAALYARISTPIGVVNAFCTHIAANLPFVNVEKENQAEIDELVAFVRNKTADLEDPTIFIMGDFNMSPEDVTIRSSFETSYNKMINHGFADTIIKVAQQTGTNPPCTYCPSNQLAGAFFPTTPRALDHIFVNVNATICVVDGDRFATEAIVTVDSPDSPFPLSDHYGYEGVYCDSTQQIGPTPTSPIAKFDSSLASASSMLQAGFCLFVCLLISAFAL